MFYYRFTICLILLLVANLTASNVCARELALGGTNSGMHTSRAITDDGGATWELSTDSSPWGYNARSTDGLNETRLLIEFEPTGITGPVTVQSATLSYFANQHARWLGYTVVHFLYYGYSDADGICTGADVEKLDTLVGVGEDFDGSRFYYQTIDPAFVQSAMNNGGRFGFVFRQNIAVDNPETLSIISTASSSNWDDKKPMLTIQYTIPEPGSLSVLGVVAMVILKRK